MVKEFGKEFGAARQETSAVVERVACLGCIIVGGLEVGGGLIQMGGD
jgi:hypothetical protein